MVMITNFQERFKKGSNMRKIRITTTQFETLKKCLPVDINLGNFKKASLTPAFINGKQHLMATNKAWDFIEQDYVELEIINEVNA